MKQAIKIVSTLAIAILALDFIFFVGWVMSGQTPVDGFYFGAITANIIKAIIF